MNKLYVALILSIIVGSLSAAMPARRAVAAPAQPAPMSAYYIERGAYIYIAKRDWWGEAHYKIHFNTWRSCSQLQYWTGWSWIAVEHTWTTNNESWISKSWMFATSTWVFTNVFDANNYRAYCWG